MAPGAHTLELAAFVVDDGSIIEGPRSLPLRVTVVGSTAGAAPTGAGQPTSEVTTADGVRLRPFVVTDGLESPTAVAFAPDGRMFVAERAGRVRVVTDAGLDREPALTIDDLSIVSRAEGGLMGLALDPDFDRTRFVYVLHTHVVRDGTPVFRLARFREAGGRLGERAVLLDNVPAAPDRPAGAIGFGPDGKLYAAFDAAGDPSNASRVASYAGKVLRLNSDGTTPADQPAGTPVHSIDYHSPRGFDWHPVTGELWVADRQGARAEELRVANAEPSRLTAGARQVRIPLPAGTDAASVAFYRGNLLPAFRGDLLVASRESASVMRLRFERRDSTRVRTIEQLLKGSVAAVQAVSVGPDGALYICTDNAVIRVGPVT